MLLWRCEDLIKIALSNECTCILQTLTFHRYSFIQFLTILIKKETQPDSQTARQTDGRTDRKTDTQTDRHADRKDRRKDI